MINGCGITLGSQVVSSSTIRVEAIGPPRITASRQISSSGDRCTLDPHMVVKSREASPTVVCSRRQHVIDLRPTAVYDLASAIRVDFNTPVNVQCRKVAGNEKCTVLGEGGRGYIVTIEPLLQEDQDGSLRDPVESSAGTQAPCVADNFRSSGSPSTLNSITNNHHLAYVPRSTSMHTGDTPACEEPPCCDAPPPDHVVSSNHSVRVVPRGDPADFADDQRVLGELSALLQQGLAVETATATCLAELQEAYPAYFK